MAVISDYFKFSIIDHSITCSICRETESIPFEKIDASKRTFTENGEQKRLSLVADNVTQKKTIKDFMKHHLQKCGNYYGADLDKMLGIKRRRKIK